MQMSCTAGGTTAQRELQTMCCRDSHLKGSISSWEIREFLWRREHVSYFGKQSPEIKEGSKCSGEWQKKESEQRQRDWKAGDSSMGHFAWVSVEGFGGKAVMLVKIRH